MSVEYRERREKAVKCLNSIEEFERYRLYDYLDRYMYIYFQTREGLYYTWIVYEVFETLSEKELFIALKEIFELASKNKEARTSRVRTFRVKFPIVCWGECESRFPDFNYFQRMVSE